jgi:N-acetyl-anhydromuramyl-L-alanine amidase AmpD
MQSLAAKFVQAAHFTRADRSYSDIDLVVIHTTEGPETERRSDATAAWFADQRSGGSAHYVVDPVQIVQCVREEDVAWGAGGANRRGIHIELCGKAGQTAADWADGASRAELDLAARLVADLCRRYSIPEVRLDPAALKAGATGIAGHADCSQAFGGTHWDPGPAFPWDLFLDEVRGQVQLEGG